MYNVVLSMRGRESEEHVGSCVYELLVFHITRISTIRGLYIDDVIGIHS